MSAGPRILFFGRTAESSCTVLTAVSREHQVAGVVETQPRGRMPPPRWRRWLDEAPKRRNLQRRARELGLPYWSVTTDRKKEIHAIIDRLQPDIGVIVKMAFMLPREIIDRFPRGVLNIHPSRLPLYRGPNPVFWMHFHQEKEAGVTVHFVDEGEDTGDIVAQESLPLPFGQSFNEFEKNFAAASGRMVPEVLTRLAQGTLERRPQRDLACPFRARAFRPGETPIDFTHGSIEQVYHMLRAGSSDVDVLPPRAFPFSLADWEAVGFAREPGGVYTARIQWNGRRFYLQLPEGRIFLRPRFSYWRMRSGWKEHRR